jgi:hypothetical protein
MASREKDSSDFDLETFIDLFDTALSSDNPAVKRALKNLLMIATLVDSDLTPEQRVKGPLRRLVEDLRDITRRMDRLESEKVYPQTVRTPHYSPPYTVGTGISTTWPPGTIIGTGTASGGYTLTSTTAVDDQYLPDQQFMNDLLDQKYQEVLKRLEEK